MPSNKSKNRRYIGISKTRIIASESPMRCVECWWSCRHWKTAWPLFIATALFIPWGVGTVEKYLLLSSFAATRKQTSIPLFAGRNLPRHFETLDKIPCGLCLGWWICRAVSKSHWRAGNSGPRTIVDSVVMAIWLLSPEYHRMPTTLNWQLQRSDACKQPLYSDPWKTWLHWRYIPIIAAPWVASNLAVRRFPRIGAAMSKPLVSRKCQTCRYVINGLLPNCLSAMMILLRKFAAKKTHENCGRRTCLQNHVISCWIIQ